MISRKNENLAGNTVVVDDIINIDGFDNNFNLIINLDDSKKEDKEKDTE
jgi:hypothetical protein